MTSPPDWAITTPGVPVHTEPATSGGWESLSQDQLRGLRENLMRSLLGAVLQAVQGLFIPGTLTDVIGQLSDWASNIPFLGPLVEAITGVFGGGLSAITDFFGGFLSGESGSLLTQVVEAFTGLGGGLLDIESWSGGLLNIFSSLFAGNLFGQVPGGSLGLLPASHVAGVSPNLVTDGTFDTAASLGSDPVWTWDDALDHTGTTGSGSAKVTANGLVKNLHSNLIGVGEDQELSGSGWVTWADLTRVGGTNPIGLGLTCYSDSLGKNQISTPTFKMDTSGLPGSGWRQLAGTYTVPAGVTSVRIRATVTADATGGTINVDDISLTKTNPISQGLIGGLLPAFQNVTDWFQDLIDNIIHALSGIPIVGGLISDVFGEMGNLVGQVNSTNSTANTALGGLNGLLGDLLNNTGGVLGTLPDDNVPGIGNILSNIAEGVAGLFGFNASHEQATGILTQQSQTLVAAQAEIALLKTTLTSGVSATESFNRSGAIGSDWAVITAGSHIHYPIGGGGSVECDGNNLRWDGSGNNPNSKLYRWVGPNRVTSTDYQAVQIILGGQGEDPFLGDTSYDHVLARVSDDGLNYLRLQVSAYAGNDDDIALYYCVGGVETLLYVGGFSPVVGNGASVTLLAGLKGSNARTYTVVVNSNPIVQVTEQGAVSQVGAGFRGTGVGMSAGNNMGFWPFLRQALPGKVNTWTAQDQ